MTKRLPTANKSNAINVLRFANKQNTGCGLSKHSHVVLDESLDFVAGEFIFTVCDRAVFKLVVESWWAEQDDCPTNQKIDSHYSLISR